MALTKIGKEGITGIDNSSDATAITIDSSENVGIGTTQNIANSDANDTGAGAAFFGMSASQTGTGVHISSRRASPLVLNRMADDGGIITLNSRGVAVGSIGVTGTDILYVANPDGSAVGFNFDGDSPKINPCDGTGSGTNGVADLGHSGGRYKTLYLSEQLSLSNGTTNGFIQSSGDLFQYGTANAKDLVFYSNNTERMRVLSGGQLVINATSLPVTGAEKLGVNGGGSSGSVAMGGTCQHNLAIPLYLTNSSNTTNTYLAKFATGSGGSTRGEIYFNGSSLVYATSSDYRLKENVNYDFDATTKVKQLKPAEYRWIEHQKDDIGFLAHEVQDVFPNAVGGEKDETNADGSIKPQSYDPSKLVPLLTKALQEAITKIETLETAKTELEARITALENA